MSRGTKAFINLRHLKHNFNVLNELANGQLILVVKADAYGHGLKQIVIALDQATCFAVATIGEALTIRKIRPRVRIVLLEGFLDQSELNTAMQNNFECVIHQHEQIRMLENDSSIGRITVWLKYDSGMNRLGFNDQDFSMAQKTLIENKKVKEIILMSHLASSDQIDNPFNQQQKKKFLTLNKGNKISLSNSAALLSQQHIDGEWCRIGLALFGVSPIENMTASDFDLKPVMTLKTNVIAIKNVKKGESIGYGQTYTATDDKRIAIIGIGYGDGYPWGLSQSACVQINQQNANILGRVSMDMMAIDISGIEDVKQGDSVLLWGQHESGQLLIENVATNTNTIPYVLLCQVTSRVHYHYVDQ